MKRYLLFTFSSYYPEGGWADFKGSYDSISEAVEALHKPGIWEENHQIVDTAIGKVLKDVDTKETS